MSRHLMGPSIAVQDLVQETFIKAYQQLKRFREDGPFGHWVLRIATNIARSHYRQNRRTPWRLWDHPEHEASVPSQVESVEEEIPNLHAVHQALSYLSPALREAVILFELEGLSLAEMAAELQVPLHTAASRVRRGRDRLRKALNRMGFSPVMQGAVALCTGDQQ